MNETQTGQLWKLVTEPTIASMIDNICMQENPSMWNDLRSELYLALMDICMRHQGLPLPNNYVRKSLLKMIKTIVARINKKENTPIAISLEDLAIDIPDTTP